MEQQSSAALLDDVRAFIARFVVLTDHQLDVIAVYTLHAWAIDAAFQTPYLNISSPVMGCGKSRLLDVLGMVLPHGPNGPSVWIRPSEAVAFRYIEAMGTPTILLDEIDTIWNEKGNEHEGLRALINSGHRRGATVPRCINFGAEIAEFKTFCPKVLAGIGSPPATIADRSIPIAMKRRTRSEPIERFRTRDETPVAAELQRRAMDWAKGNVDGLRNARPELPEALSDRQQEAVEPLLAIADLAGGRWPDDLRMAFEAMFGEVEHADDSLKMRCLADCRDVLAHLDSDRFTSDYIVHALQQIPESPWPFRVPALNAHGLAFLLRDFGVTPHSIRFKDPLGVRRGYYRAEFEDAWSRYLAARDVALVAL